MTDTVNNQTHQGSWKVVGISAQLLIRHTKIINDGAVMSKKESRNNQLWKTNTNYSKKKKK